MAIKRDAGVIRSRVVFDELDGLLITIPAVKNWPFAIFMGVWLCGWVLGELVALGAISVHFLFDHGGKTHRFGIQLSESESRRLIKTIKERYKIQEDKDEALPVERW